MLAVEKGNSEPSIGVSSMTIDPTHNPKTIEMANAEGKSIPGIYRLEGSR